MRWRCTCPFLQHVLGEFRLVPIVAGDAPPEAVAAVFDALWGGPETLIVVSTDLSHYLDYAACRRLDQSTAEAIERFDIDALGPTEACGAVPTRGLLLAARQRGHGDRAARPAQLRRHGRSARPRGGLRRLGAVRGAPPDAERAAVEAVGPTLIELVPPVDRVRARYRPGAACDRERRAGAAAGRAWRRLRHAAPREGALRGCIGSAVAYAAAGRRRGAARVQRGVPRLAVPAAGLAGAGGAVAVGLGADAARADAVSIARPTCWRSFAPGWTG